MSLARHIKNGDWASLEEAWTDLILKDAPLEPALEAVDAAAVRRELARCLALVRDHAEVLLANERPGEAAELLGKAMVQGGSPGELGKPLYDAARAAWGEEPYWDTYSDIADLRVNAPDLRASWRSFRKLLAIEPGRVVYHAKGWGLGTIEAVDYAEGLARVRFATGRSDAFPLRTAIEIFEILERNDLRALVVLDPAELRRLLAEQPLEILRWVLRRNRGKANHAGIKLALGTLGIEGSRFSQWWKKARKLAETSEWFELSGPTTRVQVRLLDRAEDPAEGLRRQLSRSSLPQALTRVRALLSGGQAQEELKSAALETLVELSSQPQHELSERLAVWLFLREATGATPEPLQHELAAAAAAEMPSDPSKPPALWALFQAVPGVREQERCIDLLREADPESWLDDAARHLPHAAPGMARPLVDALEEAGRRGELIAHYGALLARPTRNPTVLVRLAEHVEPRAPDSEALPSALQRAQCLLQLAVHLERSSANDAPLGRARTRLAALLTEGRPPLLRRLLADASLETLRSLATMMESGVPRSLDRLFTKIAIERSPDVFRGEDRPFWDAPGTWTTKRGLRKREEELRILRDVKIPANSEAIGKAASFGDLSENSEWEAAIEEQRTLTSRAMEIESELREAQLIEMASIPDETATPGTAVRYRELPGGAEHEVTILGPWDADAPGVISYRSPLGQGLCGLRPGERAQVVLPSGEIEVELLAVRLVELG